MPLSTWQDKWDRYYGGLKVIFFIAKGSLNWPRNCKQLITLKCYFLFQVTWKSFIFTPAQFLWSPKLHSKRSFPNWTSGNSFKTTNKDPQYRLLDTTIKAGHSRKFAILTMHWSNCDQEGSSSGARPSHHAQTGRASCVSHLSGWRSV